MFLPAGHGVRTNYEMFKRKTLLQTHYFLCGGEMGQFVAMMICMGFYLCLDRARRDEKLPDLRQQKRLFRVSVHDVLVEKKM